MVSVASLIGRCGSSAFRLSTAVVVDVSRGLALHFGLGTKALPSWGSRTRWNNLTGGLAVRGTAGPSDRTNSPHPSSREGHHSTAGWSSSFLLSDVILYGFHAATACSLVQRDEADHDDPLISVLAPLRSTLCRYAFTASKWVSSFQIRPNSVASLRATATRARFGPRRVSTLRPQLLRAEGLLTVVNSTFAAS